MEKSKDRIGAEQMLEGFKADPENYGLDKNEVITIVEAFLTKNIWKNDDEMESAIHNLIWPSTLRMRNYNSASAQIKLAVRLIEEVDKYRSLDNQACEYRKIIYDLREQLSKMKETK